MLEPDRRACAPCHPALCPNARATHAPMISSCGCTCVHVCTDLSTIAAVLVPPLCRARRTHTRRAGQRNVVSSGSSVSLSRLPLHRALCSCEHFTSHPRTAIVFAVSLCEPTTCPPSSTNTYGALSRVSRAQTHIHTRTNIHTHTHRNTHSFRGVRPHENTTVSPQARLSPTRLAGAPDVVPWSSPVPHWSLLEGAV